MDAALPELGPGIIPADCSLWGKAYLVPVKGKSRDTIAYPKAVPVLFRRPGVGGAHIMSAGCQCLIGMQKIYSICYRKKQTGNTIIRKEIRQHKNNSIRQQISTYLVPVNKEFSSIDTRFFTASF